MSEFNLSNGWTVTRGQERYANPWYTVDSEVGELQAIMYDPDMPETVKDVKFADDASPIERIALLASGVLVGDADFGETLDEIDGIQSWIGADEIAAASLLNFRMRIDELRRKLYAEQLAIVNKDLEHIRGQAYVRVLPKDANWKTDFGVLALLHNIELGEADGNCFNTTLTISGRNGIVARMPATSTSELYVPADLA